MTMIISGDNGATFPDSTVQTTTGKTGFVNRIINGAMVIDQRNAGASVATTPIDGIYTLDRWQAVFGVASKFTVQQNAGSVTPPAGFNYYLGITSTSAYTSSSSDYLYMHQKIEGYNVGDLAWGTANAKTVTLSFWVRSSLTGTFGGALANSDNTRNYAFNYTISSANTWEQKTITVSGDTSGTWNTTNGIGLRVLFNIGSGSSLLTTAGSWGSTWVTGGTGSTAITGTNGATLYITGVQLEKGSTATSFDYRPYGAELALCYRYYQQLNFNSDIGANGMGIVATKYSATDSAIGNAQLLAPLRATPTITKSISTCRFVSSGGVANLSSVTSGTYGVNGPIWIVGLNNSLPAGSNGWFDVIGSIYISSEL